MTKAFILNYKGVEVVIEKVNNGVFRWYATTNNASTEQQKVNFGLGSNKFLVSSFAKEVRKNIDKHLEFNQ